MHVPFVFCRIYEYSQKILRMQYRKSNASSKVTKHISFLPSAFYFYPISQTFLNYMIILLKLYTYFLICASMVHNNNIRRNITFPTNNMSQAKLKIEFRPRKISTGHSKEKYSPYRSKQKKSEQDQFLHENKQKIASNEPIIRFRRHLQISSSKNKLKPTQEERKKSPHSNMATSTTANQNGINVMPSCPNCELLLSKIEEQTVLLQQNLKEINNTLKLPKLAKSENELTTALNNQQYAYNQKIIIGYLQQIKKKGEEAKQLKRAQNFLQNETQTLRKALSQWQQKGKQLEMELTITKTLLADRERQQNFTSDGKSTQDAATSSRSINLNQDQMFRSHQVESCVQSYKDEMKQIMAQFMQRQSFDFQKIMGELQQIKLENDMLREEVKLLNYAMEEKDAKIDLLKNQLIGFIQTSKRSQKGSLVKSVKSSKFSSKKSKKVGLRSKEVSIQCIERSAKDCIITQKRAISVIMSSKDNFVLDKRKSDTSQHDLMSDQHENEYHNMQRGRTMPISHSIKFGKRSSIIDEDKLTLAKPFLKLNKKESVITKLQKQQMEREKNQLMYFSQDKLRDLDLIRRTLEHRFKGFKFTFQQLQTQMINREDHQIAEQEIDQLLQGYPFSLGYRLRQITLEYILREASSKDNRSILNDLFCNRLRQLLADYQPTEEQQEMILVEKLKKKIYMYLDGIINQCLQVEDRHGLVSQQNMKQVLEQFKLSNLQIQMFINQCSLLSADADHLNYKQYLSIFQNDQ